MPRKTPAQIVQRADGGRFNEAAARCRGKRTDQRWSVREPVWLQ